MASEATRRTIREVIALYLSAYGRRDMDACLALFAANAIFEDPVGARRLTGKEEIAGFLRAAPAGIVTTPALDRVVECGREALFHFVMTIEGWREQAVSIEVFETIAIDEAGLITSLRAYWNESMVTGIVRTL